MVRVRVRVTCTDGLTGALSASRKAAHSSRVSNHFFSLSCVGGSGRGQEERERSTRRERSREEGSCHATSSRSPAGAPGCRLDAAVQGRLRGLAAWVHGPQPGWCRAAGGRCARLQVAEHVLQLAEQAARRLVARELRGGQALVRVRVRVGVRVWGWG